MNDFLGRLFHAITVAYAYAQQIWTWVWHVEIPFKPHAQYFLSDSCTFDADYTRVPEDAVYLEEWVYGTMKRCVVRYEGEEIPTMWTSTPFHGRARRPWIWIGDKTSEVDLTRTFDKFLVVGNRITLDLILKLIHVTDRTELMYIEPGSFREVKFPADGILIEKEYDDRR
jgi:hypothetical protein